MALKIKKTIKIPSSVKHHIVAQLGVASYSTFSFSSGSDCATVRKMWKKEGSKHSGHIATMGGAYLVAMTSTFGSVGEVLQVVLDDKKGTRFWVVICDAKNQSDSNCTKWGHKYGSNGAVDILEWYGDFSGTVSKEVSQLKDTLKKKGFLGKQIKKVLNYGAYKKGMELKGGADAVETYLKEAAEHIGKGGHKWVQEHTTIGNQGWCAATMCAIAKAVNFDNKCIPRHEYNPTNFGKAMINKYGGTYIAGPTQGESNPKVEPGDFFFLQKKKNQDKHGSGTKYASHHVGVVEKVNKKKLTVIEGNAGNNHTYKRTELDMSSKQTWCRIGWFVRPDWERVGGTSAGEGVPGLTGDGPALYDTSSTRADAILRDAAYINKKEELVVKKKNAVADLSVINYTTLVATLVAAFGGSGDGDDDDDTEYDKWDLKKIKNKTARKIIQFFIDEGFPPCSACGIAGNIQQESGFRTGAADGVGAIGLCQWMGDRAKNMKEFVGSDWKTDVEGQCEFLLKEMKSGYSDMVKTLKGYKNTKKNCRKATELFCDKFERPGKPMMSKRKNYAVTLWEKIKAAAFDGGKFQWPVPGHKTIGSGWGWRTLNGKRQWHQGIDIPAPGGSKVVAGEAGTVVESGFNSARGNQVVISHGNKWYTRYQHHSKNCVKQGDKVQRGEKVGEVGNTGYSFGNHLHFEVLHGGTSSNIDKQHDDVNPTKYLKK